MHQDLDSSGDQPGIGHPFRPQAHRAFDRNDVFAPKRMGPSVRRLVGLRIEHHLGDAFAVPQIDEDEPPVISSPIHPSHEPHPGPHVPGSKAVAIVRLDPIPQAVQRDLLGFQFLGFRIVFESLPGERGIMSHHRFLVECFRINSVRKSTAVASGTSTWFFSIISRSGAAFRWISSWPRMRT